MKNISNHLAKQNNALINLKQKQLDLDIKELNNELLIIKHLIRKKQKSLRELKFELIKRATKGPFLQIVDSPPSPNIYSRTKENHADHNDCYSQPRLECLQGGKNPCK